MSSKIVLVTAHHPNDVSRWSGTPYYIYKSLRENSGDVGYVRDGLALLDLIARLVNRCSKQIGIKLDCRFSTAFSMLAGIYLTIRLGFLRKGALLFIGGSNYVPYLLTNRKIIYISDATFRAMTGIYPDFLAFPKWLQRQGDRNEARCIARADAIIYSSRWALDSATTHYAALMSKIVELPFGPNIPDDLIHTYYRPKTMDQSAEIRILFVSADWRRKNGDLVIAVCKGLLKAGITLRLILVGDTPEYAKHLDFVDDLGFLRKSDPPQMSTLCRAYRDAHFLLLPTTAEAFGIVFSEAQAFGLPSIAYDVGGVGSAIIQGQTGSLLPIGATEVSFVDELMRYIRDPVAYQETSQHCRTRYLQDANWNRWSDLILQIAGT